jgi:hypothetical protein
MVCANVCGLDCATSRAIMTPSGSCYRDNFYLLLVRALCVAHKLSFCPHKLSSMIP